MEIQIYSYLVLLHKNLAFNHEEMTDFSDKAKTI